LADRASVVRADVTAWLGGPGSAGAGPFAVVVVDPPYGQLDLLVAVLEALDPSLAPGARVVAKHFWRDQPPTRVGLLASERERRFGETALTFYRFQEDR
jgi:16S rRNA G966 N2-methylase RsmD